jgi:Fe-S-cluster-containing hydrogenase component 2
MDRQAVWVDLARCTGCGLCVEECPVGAIALADGKACVDTERCTGCEACMGACPQGAIQPLVRGELVPASERPVPVVRQPSPLAEAASSVVVATGVGLLVKAAGLLSRAVGRWLTRSSTRTEPSVMKASSAAAGEATASRGRRARHRRRGP